MGDPVQRDVAGQLLQDRTAFLLGHRLQAVVQDAKLDGLSGIGEIGIAGDHHEKGLQILALRLRQQLQPGHAGHADIYEAGVYPLFCQYFPGIRGGGGGVDVPEAVCFPGQGMAQGGQGEFFIID